MIRKNFLKCGLPLLMVLLAMLAMTATPALAASAWRPVGSPNFTVGGAVGDSLYVYNGTPYVLYSDSGGGLTVMEYTGGSWQPVGSPDFANKGLYSSPYMYNGFDTSLYVDNGTPYVAYKDGTSLRAAVMEYTGGSWQMVGGTPVSSAATVGESLYVYNGTPYLAYEDFANEKATVMEYTGGSWQMVGGAPVSNPQAGNESLYVYNGTPYLAYQDGANGGKATVIEYTGGSWQPVGSPSFSSGMAGNESLYVYNGAPYLAYYDSSNDVGPAVLMEYTGGSWQMVSSSCPGVDLSVSNGTPYVAYRDSGGLTVAEYTGGSWQMVGGAPVSSGEAGDESLFVYNGTPYVAYSDGLFPSTGPATVMECPVIKVDINGSPLQLDVAPQIVNGRTLAPLRAIFEALGATVQWNPADQSITAAKGNTTIKLQIGSTTALNNGAQITLDAAPTIVNGRTLAPVRFVGEALGAQVSWDAANYQVNIVTASP